jgi:DNA-binding Lrp family transcriptional regulator
MDELARAVVNRLQGGFPLVERPFAAAAQELGTDEATLIAKVQDMLAAGTLTRFGPMYDVERLGGAFTLCAMRVPLADVERVAALVNAHPEVAHNYARAHDFNLWFVVAAAAGAQIAPLIAAIEAETGYPVLDLPREQEYFIELRLVA